MPSCGQRCASNPGEAANRRGSKPHQSGETGAELGGFVRSLFFPLLNLTISLPQTEKDARLMFREWKRKWGADNERGRFARPFVEYILEHYGDDKLPQWAMAFRARILGCAPLCRSEISAVAV